MARRLDWVKFYFTDWMVSVRRMGWAARGVYMEALSLQFHGERLPVALEDWRHLFPGACDDDIRQVMSRFTAVPDECGGYMVNRRLEAEMNAVSLRKERGRSAAAMRWQSQGNAEAMPTQCHREEKRGEEKRETIMLDQVERDIVDLSETARRATPRRQLRMPEGALDRIWELFPKRVGKRTALALLDKAIRDYAREWELDDLGDAAEWMRERVADMAKRYEGTDEKYIPHPSTWLRQGRYEDQVEAA